MSNEAMHTVLDGGVRKGAPLTVVTKAEPVTNAAAKEAHVAELQESEGMAYTEDMRIVDRYFHTLVCVGVGG